MIPFFQTTRALLPKGPLATQVDHGFAASILGKHVTFREDWFGWLDLIYRQASDEAGEIVEGGAPALHQYLVQLRLQLQTLQNQERQSSRTQQILINQLQNVLRQPAVFHSLMQQVERGERGVPERSVLRDLLFMTTGEGVQPLQAARAESSATREPQQPMLQARVGQPTREIQHEIRERVRFVPPRDSRYGSKTGVRLTYRSTPSDAESPTQPTESVRQRVQRSAPQASLEAAKRKESADARRNVDAPQPRSKESIANVEGEQRAVDRSVRPFHDQVAQVKGSGAPKEHVGSASNQGASKTLPAQRATTGSTEKAKVVGTPDEGGTRTPVPAESQGVDKITPTSMAQSASHKVSPFGIQFQEKNELASDAYSEANGARVAESQTPPHVEPAEGMRANGDIGNTASAFIDSLHRVEGIQSLSNESMATLGEMKLSSVLSDNLLPHEEMSSNWAGDRPAELTYAKEETPSDGRSDEKQPPAPSEYRSSTSANVPASEKGQPQIETAKGAEETYPSDELKTVGARPFAKEGQPSNLTSTLTDIHQLGKDSMLGVNEGESFPPRSEGLQTVGKNLVRDVSQDALSLDFEKAIDLTYAQTNTVPEGASAQTKGTSTHERNQATPNTSTRNASAQARGTSSSDGSQATSRTSAPNESRQIPGASAQAASKESASNVSGQSRGASSVEGSQATSRTSDLNESGQARGKSSQGGSQPASSASALNESKQTRGASTQEGSQATSNTSALNVNKQTQGASTQEGSQTTSNASASNVSGHIRGTSTQVGSQPTSRTSALNENGQDRGKSSQDGSRATSSSSDLNESRQTRGKSSQDGSRATSGTSALNEIGQTLGASTQEGSQTTSNASASTVSGQMRAASSLEGSQTTSRTSAFNENGQAQGKSSQDGSQAISGTSALNESMHKAGTSHVEGSQATSHASALNESGQTRGTPHVEGSQATSHASSLNESGQTRETSTHEGSQATSATSPHAESWPAQEASIFADDPATGRTPAFAESQRTRETSSLEGNQAISGTSALDESRTTQGTSSLEGVQVTPRTPALDGDPTHGTALTPSQAIQRALLNEGMQLRDTSRIGGSRQGPAQLATGRSGQVQSTWTSVQNGQLGELMTTLAVGPFFLTTSHPSALPSRLQVSPFHQAWAQGGSSSATHANWLSLLSEGVSTFGSEGASGSTGFFPRDSRFQIALQVEMQFPFSSRGQANGMGMQIADANWHTLFGGASFADAGQAWDSVSTIYRMLFPNLETQNESQGMHVPRQFANLLLRQLSRQPAVILQSLVQRGLASISSLEQVQAVQQALGLDRNASANLSNLFANRQVSVDAVDSILRVLKTQNESSTQESFVKNHQTRKILFDMATRAPQAFREATPLLQAFLNSAALNLRTVLPERSGFVPRTALPRDLGHILRTVFLERSGSVPRTALPNDVGHILRTVFLERSGFFPRTALPNDVGNILRTVFLERSGFVPHTVLPKDLGHILRTVLPERSGFAPRTALPIDSWHILRTVLTNSSGFVPRTALPRDLGHILRNVLPERSGFFPRNVLPNDLGLIFRTGLPESSGANDTPVQGEGWSLAQVRNMIESLSPTSGMRFSERAGIRRLLLGLSPTDREEMNRTVLPSLISSLDESVAGAFPASVYTLGGGPARHMQTQMLWRSLLPMALNSSRNAPSSTVLQLLYALSSGQPLEQKSSTVPIGRALIQLLKLPASSWSGDFNSSPIHLNPSSILMLLHNQHSLGHGLDQVANPYGQQQEPLTKALQQAIATPIRRTVASFWQSLNKLNIGFDLYRKPLSQLASDPISMIWKLFSTAESSTQLEDRQSWNLRLAVDRKDLPSRPIATRATSGLPIQLRLLATSESSLVPVYTNLARLDSREMTHSLLQRLHIQEREVVQDQVRNRYWSEEEEGPSEVTLHHRQGQDQVGNDHDVYLDHRQPTPVAAPAHQEPQVTTLTTTSTTAEIHAQTDPSATALSQVDVDRLVDRVYRELQKKLAFERSIRGI